MLLPDIPRKPALSFIGMIALSMSLSGCGVAMHQANRILSLPGALLPGKLDVVPPGSRGNKQAGAEVQFFEVADPEGHRAARSLPTGEKTL